MGDLEIRLWGDPFRGDGASVELRRWLARVTREVGWRCGLSLSGAVGEEDGRIVTLTDGTRESAVRTRLPDAELLAVLGAARTAVAATAPLIVFGHDDDFVLAGLEYPLARAVWRGGEVDLDEVRRELASAPLHDPEPSMSLAELEPLLRLPSPPPLESSRLVHFGSVDGAHGTDLAVSGAARAGAPLTVVWPEHEVASARESEGALSRLAEQAANGASPDIVFTCTSDRTAALANASAVLMPARVAPPAELLLGSLASGRPVLVSRWSATAGVLSAPGLCVPIGGRQREGGRFEPDPASVHAAINEVMEGSRSLPSPERVRRHVLERHRRGVPAPTTAGVRGARPVLVLEAPLFERSSASVLTLATAHALARRGRVDVRLVPVVPFERDLAWFRAAAPDLEPVLCRRPAGADLWLSTGWPPRANRPLADRFAVRIDWEYGALPAELAPVVVDEPDRVVVHSRAVARTLQAAGCPAERITLLPHGVDGSVFHEGAEPNEDVLRFKAGRPALLFVGGLIWRKGFDLVLSALLKRPDCCLVIKAIGSATTYAGYHLGELLDKVRRHSAAPDVLLIEDDLSAAEMAGLYRACDLLLHPYRGEGFGMPVLEARACGLPVVVTRGGSTDDFCDGPGHVPVEAGRRVLELPGAHLGRTWVLDPAHAAVDAALSDALANLTSLQRAAQSEAPGVRARFDWARVAQTLERLVFEGRCWSGGQPRRADVTAISR